MLRILIIQHTTGSIYKYSDDVYVVYTKEAETADNYIERTTETMKENYDITVATSDGLEQIIIMSKGARRISANDLLDDVKRSKKYIREQIQSYKPIKNNMLIKNLDKETAEWMEKMRRQ